MEKLEIDMSIDGICARWNRARKKDSLTHWKGKRVGTFEPSLLQKAQREAFMFFLRHGAGLLFSVYGTLEIEHKNLLVTLPVSQFLNPDNTGAKELQRLELVIVNDNKMYPMPFLFGVNVKIAKEELAQSFQDNAERAMQGIRSMIAMAEKDIKKIKPAWAKDLYVESERIYSYVASTYANEIENNKTGAKELQQAWKNELLQRG